MLVMWDRVAKELSRAKGCYRVPFAVLRRIRGVRRGVRMGSDHGRQEIFKNVGVRRRRTQGGHEGLQAGVECGCRRARTPLNRRGELVSNESGGGGRVGPATKKGIG